MIINHDLRFIFLHVPKNAGTSVTTWLSNYTSWNDIELGGTVYGEQIQEIYCRRFKLHKHSPASEVHSVVGSEIWRRYFKFAIVRHPLDRLVSAFEFYRRWDHPSAAPARLCQDLGEFLRSGYFEEDSRNCTRATGCQAQFLRTGEAPPVDRIYYFESLEEDMAEVADRLGIEPPNLTKGNGSVRGAYEDYYTTETRDLARSVYMDDLRAFGYALS